MKHIWCVVVNSPSDQIHVEFRLQTQWQSSEMQKSFREQMSANNTWNTATEEWHWYLLKNDSFAIRSVARVLDFINYQLAIRCSTVKLGYYTAENPRETNFDDYFQFVLIITVTWGEYFDLDSFFLISLFQCDFGHARFITFNFESTRKNVSLNLEKDINYKSQRRNSKRI